MVKIFSQDVVNTGRQVEFDYGKGLFILAILFVHAFQIAGRGNGANSLVYQVIYMTAVMSGATLFIFVQGMGTCYSKTATPGRLVAEGARLVGYQYLNNIAYVVSLVLPFVILQFFMNPAKETLAFLLRLYIQYINIFFLAGAIYLILALFKKIKLPIYAYLVLGLGLNFFNGRLVGFTTGCAVVDYLIAPIFGGPMHVSFCIMTYLPYALVGVCFGKVLLHVQDKDRFYRSVMIFTGGILAAWCFYLFIEISGFQQLYQFLGRGYIYPDGFRTIANTATVLFITGFLYFIRNYIGKWKWLEYKLKYISQHISKYYAIHPTFYLLAFGFHAYESFGFWGCLVLFAFCMLYTEGIVVGYNKFLNKRENESLV